MKVYVVILGFVTPCSHASFHHQSRGLFETLGTIYVITWCDDGMVA